MKRNNNPHHVWKPRAALPSSMRRRVDYLDPTRALPYGLTWYVLEVERLKEAVVANWLERNGCFSLVPLQIRQRRIARTAMTRRSRTSSKTESYQVPWLPGMVIAGFASAPPWLTITEHRNIIGPLKVCGRPSPMRYGEAEKLQLGSEALRSSMEPKEAKPGDAAKYLKAGIFVGKQGVIVSATTKWAHIRGLLDGDSIGGRVVRVDRDCIEVLAAA